MIIYQYCTSSDNALLVSFLLTCHPYVPFDFMNDFYTCRNVSCVAMSVRVLVMCYGFLVMCS